MNKILFYTLFFIIVTIITVSCGTKGNKLKKSPCAKIIISERIT